MFDCRRVYSRSWGCTRVHQPRGGLEGAADTDTPGIPHPEDQPGGEGHRWVQPVRLRAGGIQPIPRTQDGNGCLTAVIHHHVLSIYVNL